jgi:hypothetical protein
MSSSYKDIFSPVKTRVQEHRWSINTLFLVAALIISITALVYAVQNRKDINKLEDAAPNTKSNFESGYVQDPISYDANAYNWTEYSKPSTQTCSDDYSGYQGTTLDNTACARTTTDGYDFWSKLPETPPTTHTGSCANVPEVKPFLPHNAYATGSPQMINNASNNSYPYPDETVPQSLIAKPIPGCDGVPLDTNPNPMNLDNLVPASWRSDYKADPSEPDVDSQWTKFGPTKAQFYRYRTAAGSARLGVNTRNSLSKIIGQQNLLRQATMTPLSTTNIPWHESSHRADFVASVTNNYNHLNS